MFMLRMIGSNSGDFVCTQVLHNLWKLFLCKKYAFAKLQECKGKTNQNDESNNTNNPDDKKHKFDLEFDDDTNEDTNNNYTSCSKEQVFNRNYKLKLTSNNNSKKKRFFAKIFSEPKTTPASSASATGANRKLIQPLAKMRSEAFNNDAKRFQSLKRVAINRRINNQPL